MPAIRIPKHSEAFKERVEFFPGKLRTLITPSLATSARHDQYVEEVKRLDDLRGEQGQQP